MDKSESLTSRESGHRRVRSRRVSGPLTTQLDLGASGRTPGRSGPVEDGNFGRPRTVLPTGPPWPPRSRCSHGSAPGAPPRVEPLGGRGTGWTSVYVLEEPAETSVNRLFFLGLFLGPDFLRSRTRRDPGSGETGPLVSSLPLCEGDRPWREPPRFEGKGDRVDSRPRHRDSPRTGGRQTGRRGDIVPPHPSLLHWGGGLGDVYLTHTPTLSTRGPDPDGSGLVGTGGRRVHPTRSVGVSDPYSRDVHRSIRRRASVVMYVSRSRYHSPDLRG